MWFCKLLGKCDSLFGWLTDRLLCYVGNVEPATTSLSVFDSHTIRNMNITFRKTRSTKDITEKKCVGCYRKSTDKKYEYSTPVWFETCQCCRKTYCSHCFRDNYHFYYLPSGQRCRDYLWNQDMAKLNDLTEELGENEDREGY